MNRQKKGRLSILTAAVLLVLLFFTGFRTLSCREVSAAPSEEGVFHLKKYVDVSEQHEATGQEEVIADSSNSLYGKEVMADVVYEIYRTYDYIDGKLVEIASGPVKILNNGENYKTDFNGEINISGLPLGQYTFKEVSAPDGIQIDHTEYTFVLPYKLGDNTELQYEVYVYPKNVSLTGSLSFKKVGDNGTDGLKNVIFEVYQEDGSLVCNEDGSSLTVTTRLSGEAVVEELLVGKYYLVETQNPDSEYQKSSTIKYWFEIYDDSGEIKSKSFYSDVSMDHKIQDADGVELAEGTIINYKTPSVEKTAAVKNEQDIKDGLVYVDSEGKLYTNVDIPYTYTIKTTLPKDLVTYTKFEIYDAFTAGNIVLVTALEDIKPVAIGGNSQPELVSGEDYEVVREGTEGYRLRFTAAGITKLISAKCTSVEVTFDAKIPEGYQVNSSVKTGENNDAVVEFGTIHSDPSESFGQNTVYPRAGEIMIHKVSGTDTTKLLAGAEFSLKDAAGNEYWGTEYVKYMDVNGKLTNDASAAATFIFTQLPFGTYTLQETKAPSGYNISTATKTIYLLPDEDKSATWLSYEGFFQNTVSASVSANKTGQANSSLLPKTGDETNMTPYIIGLLCCGTVLIIFIYRKIKRSSKQ